MTTETIDAEKTTTIEQLTEEYIKGALSSGEAPLEVLRRHIAGTIQSGAPITREEAAKGFALIKQHTHRAMPSELGIYLKLFHGRTPFDMQMEDWGLDGPWIGPMKWIHFTYLSSFRIVFLNGEEYWSGAANGLPPSPLYCHEDCMYFDGIYYGDWEFQSLPDGLES